MMVKTRRGDDEDDGQLGCMMVIRMGHEWGKIMVGTKRRKR